MRSLAAVVSKGFTSGVVALTGAAPITGAGTTFDTRQAARDSLSCQLDYNIKANNLTYTATWQVSVDGSTWVTARGPNAPADVTFATGNASDVAGSLCLSAPQSVYGYRYCRISVTTGGAATGVVGHDNFTATYSYVKSQLGS